MVEGARLESVFTGNRNAGSNPALSAKLTNNMLKARDFIDKGWLLPHALRNLTSR